MNWVRILVFTIALVLLPTVVGFVFGVTNSVWRDTIDADAAFWMRQIVVVLLVLLAYVVLAVKQRQHRLAHLAVVFIASESVSTMLHVGIGGPLGSALTWVGLSAIAAASAYLFAEFLHSSGRRAA